MVAVPTALQSVPGRLNKHPSALLTRCGRRPAERAATTLSTVPPFPPLGPQSCMVMVEQSQVWVGSEDGVIYIIHTHSMSCNKQLTDHRSAVTGLAVQDGKKPRYSGSTGEGRRSSSLLQHWPGHSLLLGLKAWCPGPAECVLMVLIPPARSSPAAWMGRSWHGT